MHGIERNTDLAPDGRPAPAIAGLRNVFLIGLMGAGKTTVGKHLARLLKFDFVDADREIEARTGTSIPVIFEIEGEDGFRRRESAVIAELVKRHGIVLATGGGAVMSPVNREQLRANGTVTYLRAELDTLVNRTRHSTHRPLLNSGDPRARLAALLDARHPLYMQTANIVVDTGHGSAQAVAHAIVEQLREAANT
jgi:shikimate kinase